MPSGSIFGVAGDRFYDIKSELALNRIEPLDSQGNQIPRIGTTFV